MRSELSKKWRGILHFIVAMKNFHQPVMLQEVLEALNPQPGQHFIDATLGAGGHAEAILERTAPDGILLGIERDPDMLAIAKERLRKFGSRLVPVCAPYDQMKEIVRQKAFGPVDGALFDLGISSWHLEHSGRGFSFQRDEPLDMRFNPDEGGPTAADILNGTSQEELAHILREYGEEPRARQIAKAIVRKRKQGRFTRTGQLVESLALWRTDRRTRHPATKIFQALRIAVNGELEILERGLAAAEDLCEPKGNIVAIAFHGLEGKIIKKILRPSKTRAPSYQEIKDNPRARSAHLYLCEK